MVRQQPPHAKRGQLSCRKDHELIAKTEPGPCPRPKPETAGFAIRIGRHSGPFFIKIGPMSMCGCFPGAVVNGSARRTHISFGPQPRNLCVPSLPTLPVDKAEHSRAPSRPPRSQLSPSCRENEVNQYHSPDSAIRPALKLASNPPWGPHSELRPKMTCPRLMAHQMAEGPSIGSNRVNLPCGGSCPPFAGPAGNHGDTELESSSRRFQARSGPARPAFEHAGPWPHGKPGSFVSRMQAITSHRPANPPA